MRHSSTIGWGRKVYKEFCHWEHHTATTAIQNLKNFAYMWVGLASNRPAAAVRLISIYAVRLSDKVDDKTRQAAAENEMKFLMRQHL